MPLEKIETSGTRHWALWKISESEDDLAQRVAMGEKISGAIINPNKRLEWLAGRVVVKELMQHVGLTFQGITKNEFGKPFLAGYAHHLSLSHSYPYVAAIIDAHEPVGIDLEQPKEKLLKIAARVLDPSELQNAGSDVIKHCVYWCAKETLVKIHGKKDLIFAENMKIKPFSLANEGTITGSIIVSNSETTIPLYYRVTENFVVVFNKTKMK